MVTVSGLIYNLGLVVGPWFEGQLAQCLLGILNGNETFAAMAALCAGYLIAIAVVQGSRFIKRLYVRKFANNINRSMKRVLYANLVRKDKVELEQAGTGTLMTKAISDVDACAEGMRKFTTEIFDTGIALLALCRDAAGVRLAAGAALPGVCADLLLYCRADENPGAAHRRCQQGEHRSPERRHTGPGVRRADLPRVWL